MTSGIIEILIENTGVQNLVGRTTDNTKYKVFPVVAEKQDVAGNPIVAPYIVAWTASSDPTPSLTKDIPSMLDYPRVRIASWAKNYRDAELLAEAVREALEPSSFTTDAGYEFLRMWLVDTNEGYSPDTGLYGCFVDVACEWRKI